MELADIAKLVLNKQIAVDITEDAKSDKPRAVVDLFTREAYYPIGQFAEIYATTWYHVFYDYLYLFCLCNL